jgi:hypothetical protein
MCFSVSIRFLCVFLLQIILIEKFIKHNKINYLSSDVKYFDLYLLLNFLQHLSIRGLYFVL